MSFFKRNKNIVENNFESIDCNSLKDFIDFSSFPFVRFNINGKLLYTNQAFAKMLSYSTRSEFQEICINDLFVDKDKWQIVIAELNKKDKLENYLVDLMQKNGNKIDAEFSLKSVKDELGNPKYFEGIITQKENNNLKEILEELEHLREKEKSSASRVNKANYTKDVKSQILANMTHEIKTPINSIVGFLTLIEQHLFESEEELQDFAHNARISADSLLEMINNILDISKIEAGKMELDVAEFSLVEEVEKAKSIALPPGGKNNLKISTNIDERLKSKVIGDSLRYRQVLMNVLTKSVK